MGGGGGGHVKITLVLIIKAKPGWIQDSQKGG